MLREWKINQSITGCVIAFAGFGFGCGLSWTATALPDFDETGLMGHLSPAEKSWIGSLLAFGALIGCPIAGFLVTGQGRKMCLWGFSTLGFAGWLLLACAQTPLHIYFGRLLIGISVGGYTIVVPVFVGEIASKENRGLIGSFFTIMICLGKLYSNVIGIAVSAHFASILCAIHPLLFGFLLFLIPESPSMLSKQNKKKEASKALSWLETTGFTSPFCTFTEAKLDEPREMQNNEESVVSLTSYVKTTHGTVLASDKANSKVTIKEFFSSPELVKPVLLVFGQMLLAQFCGINVTTFYTVEIFQLSGEVMLDSKWSTVILQLIQTIGCFPCSLFVDKYGRRLLLISSFFAMGLAMGGFTVYFYIKDAYVSLLTTYPLLSLTPLISLIVYNLAFCWGVGSIIWIVMSEIVPPSVIGPASAIANVIFWTAAFVVIQAFQMFQFIPVHVWFLMSSIVCFLGCLFNGFLLPETKGFTIQEIQAFFNKKSKKDLP